MLQSCHQGGKMKQQSHICWVWVAKIYQGPKGKPIQGSFKWGYRTPTEELCLWIGRKGAMGSTHIEYQLFLKLPNVCKATQHSGWAPRLTLDSWWETRLSLLGPVWLCPSCFTSLSLRSLLLLAGLNELLNKIHLEHLARSKPFIYVSHGYCSMPV